MLKLIFSENVKSPGSLESLNRLLAIPRASDRMIPWSEDETNFVTRLQSRHVHAYAKGVFSCELRSSARHKSTINVNTKKEREKKKKASSLQLAAADQTHRADYYRQLQYLL